MCGEREIDGLTSCLTDTFAFFEKEHLGVKVYATLQAIENIFSTYPLLIPGVSRSREPTPQGCRSSIRGCESPEHASFCRAPIFHPTRSRSAVRDPGGDFEHLPDAGSADVPESRAGSKCGKPGRLSSLQSLPGSRARPHSEDPCRQLPVERDRPVPLQPPVTDRHNATRVLFVIDRRLSASQGRSQLPQLLFSESCRIGESHRSGSGRHRRILL